MATRPYAAFKAFRAFEAATNVDGVGIQHHLQTRDSCPGVYRFGLGTVHIIHHRSPIKDTVYIGASLIVNGTSAKSYNITKFYGRHGVGKFLADILFDNITVADNAVAVLAYSINNIGHGSQRAAFQSMQDAAYKIAEKGLQAVTSAPKEGVALWAANLASHLGGDIAGVIQGIVDFADASKHGCDGWVGAGVHVFRGSDVCSLPVANLTGTDYDKGEDTGSKGSVCSSRTSKYDVGWFAGTKEKLGNLTVLESKNGAPSTIVGAGIGWQGLVVLGGLLLIS
ncbi:MAG: hypothetical protein M1813_004712 [Trichoglossum hirsutum]|nr:MAG: hypothetical protein M1813_004712 [Trichoglossum hirsutum]